MAAIPVLIVRLSRPRAATRTVPVWDGGIVEFRPRMQYTATTFANPIRVTFEGLYQPDVHVERASDDPAGRSGPVHYRSVVTPLFERYLYRPLVVLVERLAALVRPIQSGDVNLYLLYVFLVVMVAYLIYAYEIRSDERRQSPCARPAPRRGGRARRWRRVAGDA